MNHENHEIFVPRKLPAIRYCAGVYIRCGTIIINPSGASLSSTHSSEYSTAKVCAILASFPGRFFSNCTGSKKGPGIYCMGDERRVSRNRFLNKLVYGINLRRFYGGFTKVNKFPRFWGTQLRMCTNTHAIDSRPCFRPSIKKGKTRPGNEASAVYARSKAALV